MKNETLLKKLNAMKGEPDLLDRLTALIEEVEKETMLETVKPYERKRLQAIVSASKKLKKEVYNRKTINGAIHLNDYIYMCDSYYLFKTAYDEKLYNSLTKPDQESDIDLDKFIPVYNPDNVINIDLADIVNRAKIERAKKSDMIERFGTQTGEVYLNLDRLEKGLKMLGGEKFEMQTNGALKPIRIDTEKGVFVLAPTRAQERKAGVIR